MAVYKLIVDSVQNHQDFDYLIEESNGKSNPSLYITGPFMAACEVNRNKRIYDAHEMEEEVNRYIVEKVNQKCALGELNHPPSADLNLERACHLVTELKRDGNVWIGKSKVLNNPCGNIVRSLINDGVKIGMSTRSLGQLEESENGINKVHNMRLIAIDAVADPSYSKAYVNGILESKSYNLDFTEAEQAYDYLDKSFQTMPKHNEMEYKLQKISEFFELLSGK